MSHAEAQQSARASGSPMADIRSIGVAWESRAVDTKAYNAAGFTMIEAVIAMLVTVVGLVSIAGMFTLAMKTNASSRNSPFCPVLCMNGGGDI